MHPPPPSALRGAAPLALALVLPGCMFVKSPGAKDWNLSQLHRSSGSYHYTAELVGDFEFVMRSGTANLPLKSAVKRPLGGDKKPVPNPAAATLENLLALAAFDDEDERTIGLQVMWFARLAVQDPSILARERCVLELARFGRRLPIDVPEPLPPEAMPLGPDALGEELALLVREYRRLLEVGGTDRERQDDLDRVCRRIEASVFDLDGGRRILFAVNHLLNGLGARAPARPPLERLSRAAQKVCIELALAEALGDPAPLVRAAALRSSVEAVGTGVLAPILLQLDREQSIEVQAAVMVLVAERGLPDVPASLDEAAAERLRERWLEVIYERAVGQPDGHLQLQAMQALAKVLPPGAGSLRDEDWEQYWLARRDAARKARAERGP
jgi:hypothetical protein